jgi:cellulose synthase/poly-beta-1,6-N-acetylglucosamine synthase-like glycosyltransferase
MDSILYITYFSLLLIFYHFAAYPLLLILMDIFSSHKKIIINNKLPRASLIILAYNEESIIIDKIKNTLSLENINDLAEVIIVTDGSEDNTPNIVGGYALNNVKLLHNNLRQGKSAAINHGMEHVHGDIIIFSDANAFYYPDAISMLLERFYDPTVGAVSGRKTISKTLETITQSEGLYWKYESLIKSAETSIGSTVAVVGEMLAIRRELFKPIPSQMINDDSFIMLSILKQGYRVAYEPKAICWELSAQSMSQEAIRRRRINAGRFQQFFNVSLWPWNQPFVIFQLISHKYLRLFLAILMLTAFISTTISILVSNDSAIALVTLFIAQILFYMLSIAGWVGEMTGRRWKLPSVAYYLTASSFTALQGLYELFRGKQSVLWVKARTN